MDQIARNRAERFVLLTVFIYSAGFGIMMPVLPELIVELEGISLSDATMLGGFVAATYAIFQFLMGPLVGNLGDRFGRRPVFLLSLLGFSIDFIVMGFAQNVIWLFVGRSLAGALGAIFGPANAAMADLSSAEERAKGFGKVGAAFGIGFIIGPVLGGVLGEYGTRLPYFVAGAMAFSNFIYGWFAFPETMREQDRRRFSLKRANPLGALLSLRTLPNVVGIALVYLLWVTSTNIYPVVWAYFTPVQYGWDSKMTGFSLALVGLSMALVQTFVIGRVVGRFGEQATANFAMAAGIVGFLIFGISGNGTVALVLCMFVGIQGMTIPSINAMMSRRTPRDMQGELQGFNGSLAALAALIAPLMYNTALSYFTSDEAPVVFAGAPFILSAVLASLAMIALALGTRRQEP